MAQHLISAFNGYLREPHAFYGLGSGYREYLPGLSRFLITDYLSPFRKGGINAYAYCSLEPINRTDPSGRFWRSLYRRIFKKYKYHVDLPRGGVLKLTGKPPKMMNERYYEFISGKRAGRRKGFAVETDPSVPFTPGEQRFAMRRPSNLTSFEEKLWNVPFTEKVFSERRNGISIGTRKFGDAALVSPSSSGRVFDAGDQYLNVYTPGYIRDKRSDKLPY